MESHIDQWKWQLTKCYQEQAKMVIGKRCDAVPYQPRLHHCAKLYAQGWTRCAISGATKKNR